MTDYPTILKLRNRLAEWLHDVPAAERHARFSDIVDEFGVPDVAAEMLSMKSANAGRIAKRLSGNPLLAARHGPVRTIGLFVTRLRGGGAERVVSRLSFLFREHGLNVVLFSQEPPHAEDYPLPDGIARVLLPTKAPDPAERFRILFSALSEHHIDMFLHHAERNTWLLPDLFTVKSAGVPFVSCSHGCFGSQLITAGTYLEPQVQVQQLSDAVVVLSEDFAFCYRALGVRASVIPNPQTFVPADAPPQRPEGDVILWLSRKHPVKNYLAPLHILAYVVKKRPEAKLLMVGEPQDRGCDKKIRKLANALGVGRNLEVLPNANEVDALYDKTSVVLITSVSEASPMVLAEAMGKGVPVVLFELPYVERLKKCPAVPQVPFNDCAAAASEIVRLLESAAAWRALSEAELAVAREFADIDLFARWKALFDSLSEKPERLSSSLSDGEASAGRMLDAFLRMHSFAVSSSAIQKPSNTEDPTLLRPTPFKSGKGHHGRRIANLLNLLAWRVRQMSDTIAKRGVPRTASMLFSALFRRASKVNG